MAKSIDLSLYLVTDRSLTFGRPLLDVIEEAIQGGVSVVQLREKDCSAAEFYKLGLQVKKLVKSYRVPLIINDRLDIALACDADGLHIGHNDITYEVARKLLGKDKIIGVSVENRKDMERANQLDVDYIGISPLFDTPTKTDTAPALGLQGAHEIAALSVHPAVGIGGINLKNVADVMQTGVDGICVVSALMSAPDPKLTASQFKKLIRQHKTH